MNLKDFLEDISKLTKEEMERRSIPEYHRSHSNIQELIVHDLPCLKVLEYFFFPKEARRGACVMDLQEKGFDYIREAMDSNQKLAEANFICSNITLSLTTRNKICPKKTSIFIIISR